MKLQYILTVLLLICHSTNAEIITDGTLGQQINLPGPDFQITSNQGQQYGDNLFHSFQDFNLNSSESATFSGSNSVQNIISRVTGGNPSNIDGLISSTIPNADMYFLNPYGVIFGPNAKLDVQGSFHVSTADYLRLGENGRFDAHNPSDSILTVAPIESFGFLTNSAASIEITDSNLQVLPTKALSIIAGDINLTNTKPTVYDKASHHILTNQLIAPNGLITVDAKGTINLTNFGIDTSGSFGGQINIRGKRLEMDDSRISSHTFGEFDGQAIDIQVDNLFMQDSDIIANTYGTGDGSKINLQIDETLTATKLDRPLGVEFETNLRGSSHISTLTAGEGDKGVSGDITINAGYIDLRHAAEIRSRSFSKAKSGNITLRVADTFQAIDTVPLNIATLSIIGGVHTFSFANGDSGNIDVIAQNIILNKGSVIAASTFGAGHGGSIFIQADTINLKEQGELTGTPTAIASTSQGVGKAGKVEVHARNITLENGGTITTSSFLSGNSDKLIVTVSDTLTIFGMAKLLYKFLGLEMFYPSNISSASVTNGQANNVYIQAKHIILDAGGTIGSFTYGYGDGGNTEVIADTIKISGWQDSIPLYRSGINNSSTSLDPHAGLAGNINIAANKIIISDGGAINSSAMNAIGGNIVVNTKDMIYLLDQGSIITSVQSGIGDGGNINIFNPQFILLNQGKIAAQADAGHGGNIRITTDHLITSTDSLISASSKLGIDGNVSIDSPAINMEGFLVVLPGNFVDVSYFMVTPCYQRLDKNLSSLTIIPSEGTSNEPNDLLPSRPYFSNQATPP
ncbi:filamentous hemagglutinin N-terminal domain-containing protein [Candidatus Halobeggiatoa sp. HSG11]|nr:filamentous hemagglutinin N-terminal domain-containing protein [Candidatus Halobeggiatoa sp. HSG11]